MYDFFISHSSLDKEMIVDELVKGLEQKQFSVWYDKNNISYGDNINKEVQEGLKNVLHLFWWLHITFSKANGFILNQVNIQCFKRLK